MIKTTFGKNFAAKKSVGGGASFGFLKELKSTKCNVIGDLHPCRNYFSFIFFPQSGERIPDVLLCNKCIEEIGKFALYSERTNSLQRHLEHVHLITFDTERKGSTLAKIDEVNALLNWINFSNLDISAEC